MKSILIVQTKLIGDLVLASVLTRNLRLAYPDARITLLSDKHYAPFVLDCGIADEVIGLDRQRLRRSVMSRINELLLVARQLRRHTFDLGIDLADTRTSRNLLTVAGASRNVAYTALRGRQTLIAEPVADGHSLDRYLAPLQALGIERRVAEPSLQAPEADAARARALLEEHDVDPKAFIAVHAGARFAGRCWPPDRFAAAIDHAASHHGLRSVLVGGPGEVALTDAVAAVARGRVVNLTGHLSLRETLAVFAEARLFLGNESGPMHLAAAAGTPVVGLFGLTDPARWGPLGAPSEVVRAPMPCACHAPDICGRPDPRRAYCIQAVELPAVTGAIDQLLEQTGGSDTLGLED
ncbi:heptosyltransferase-3 [Variibacter gotjawalensis]|nr:heptosyltransferase-3 [Variibacter gotjawalensis]